MAIVQLSSKNPDFTHNSPDWKKARDVLGGQRTVHAAGEAYLARLSGQDDKEYAAYRNRTPFYNATSRTLNGLVGMVFRKEPREDMPDLLREMADDLTLSKDAQESLDFVAQSTLYEVLGIGRVGWLVEYPIAPEGVLTQAQVQAMNLRPYATQYKTEAIFDWKYDRVNNAAQLVMVKLSETVTEYDAKFKRTEIPQERWLLLEDGRYVQRVYRDEAQYGEDIVPLMNGRPLPYIPFVGCTSAGVGLDRGSPPLMDLMDINLSHYRTCADLEHGAHFTGLPTPYVSGVQLKDGDKLGIGGSTAWVFPNADAKASYLEFSGQGLGSLERLRDTKENQMAALGARMLSAEKKSAEAEGTVRMRTAGESAVLATMANRVSEAIERVLRIMAEWSGIAGDVEFHLNTDYFEADMGAQELTALVGAWQAGAISTENLYFNLQKGEMVKEGDTYEEEQERIANQAPVGGGLV